MKAVQFVRSVASPAGRWRAGEIVLLDQDLAGQLIADGFAVAAERGAVVPATQRERAIADEQERR